MTLLVATRPNLNLRVKEADGAPDVPGVSVIVVSNGTLTNDGGGQVTLNTGSGDVVGPASATDNAIVRFDGTTGKLIQDYTSGAPTVSDTGEVTVSGGFSSTHSGLQSQRFGANASATGTQSTAVGYGATANAFVATAIGNTSSANFDQAIAIGAAASVTGNNGVAIGTFSSAANNGIAIGASVSVIGSGVSVGGSSSATALQAAAFGFDADATGIQSTAIGTLAKASQFLSTAVGNGANASATFSTALGAAAAVANNQSIAIGLLATSTKVNQIVFGSSTAPTNEVAPYTLTALTNTTQNIYVASHRTSGTPAAGFGAGLRFGLETSTTEDQDAARLVALWNVATHASRSADLIGYASDFGGEREIWRGQATGTAAAIGFLGATPIIRQAHIVDADGTLADVTSKFNSLLAYLENFGFIATS